MTKLTVFVFADRIPYSKHSDNVPSTVKFVICTSLGCAIMSRLYTQNMQVRKYAFGNDSLKVFCVQSWLSS